MLRVLQPGRLPPHTRKSVGFGASAASAFAQAHLQQRKSLFDIKQVGAQHDVDFHSSSFIAYIFFIDRLDNKYARTVIIHLIFPCFPPTPTTSMLLSRSVYHIRDGVREYGLSPR